MGKIKVTIEVDECLWLIAKDKLDMSFSEFIDYVLTIYLVEDSEISALMKKGAKLQKELNQTIGRIQALENKYDKQDKKDIYEELMETVIRIHNGMGGYIGKNQLRRIATRNEINPTSFIRYVENQEGITVKKYGELPK